MKQLSFIEAERLLSLNGLRLPSDDGANIWAPLAIKHYSNYILCMAITYATDLSSRKAFSKKDAEIIESMFLLDED